MVPSRRALARALHRLDRSPLPEFDPVRIALEAELLRLLFRRQRRERIEAGALRLVR